MLFFLINIVKGLVVEEIEIRLQTLNYVVQFYTNDG